MSTTTSSDPNDLQNKNFNSQNIPKADTFTLDNNKCDATKIRYFTLNPETGSLHQPELSSNLNFIESDIFNILSKNICLLERGSVINLIDSVFVPGEKFEFPQSYFGKAKISRKFRSSWLKEFNWLRYSPSQDGAFCLPCVLFGKMFPKKNGKASKLFKQPFRHWPDGQRFFKKHQDPTVYGLHAETSLFLSEFLNQQLGKTLPINELIDSQFRKQVTENREKLVPIIDSILFCGRTGIALRSPSSR